MMGSMVEMLLRAPSAMDQYLSLGGMMGGGLLSERAQAPLSRGGPPANDWEARARRMAMNRFGYSPEDWQKLDYIIENESNWNPSAYNEGSGAAGIAQKISGYDSNYREDDPISQLRWLFQYINGHYGGIDAAYQHKTSTGWY